MKRRLNGGEPTRASGEPSRSILQIPDEAEDLEVVIRISKGFVDSKS